jgi:hypothetical protein
MNPDEPKPLPSETRELLRAEKGAFFAPDDARRRVFERLGAAMPRPGGSGGEGGQPRGVEGMHSVSSVGSGGIAASIARPVSIGLALVIGAVGGTATWNALRPAPKSPVVYIDRVVPLPVAATAPTNTESEPAEPRALPNPPSAADPAMSVTRDVDLTAERSLLDVARTALARGNGEDALVAATKHEKRYPRGDLSEEREAMAIQALVLLRRYDEARARGATFHRRFPGSVLAPGIDAALGAIP